MAQPWPTETAVIVPVPALEPAVADQRQRFDRAAAWGVPAHVTVLYPFAPPELIDAALTDRLREAVTSVEPFDCEFAVSQWFGEEVLWLAPDPDEPFRNLTRAVWETFPAYPPYGGQFDDVVPHVTLGESYLGTLSELQTAEAAAVANLPIRTRIDRAALLAGTAAPNSWITVCEFDLGTGASARRG